MNTTSTETTTEPKLERFLRIKEVSALTGLPLPSIKRLVALGRFPAPVRISGRAVAWTTSSLAQWQASCLPTRSNT